MKIQLTSVGKKYNRDWIFKNVTTTLSSESSYAITGPNGSGKSTLLKIISGFMLPTEGEIGYYKDNTGINVEEFYKFIDFSAPYVELIEEMTLKEFLRFHFSFKKLSDNYDIDDLPGLMFLEKETEKYLLNFSSGMKQRLRLGIGFYADSPVLLLDEPSTNLDEKSKLWFQERFEAVRQQKLIILASNDAEEIALCEQKIDINKYK